MSTTQPDREASAADWLVYADALQQVGDIRGELIALNDGAYGGEATAERDAFVEKHFEALFAVPRRLVAIEWSRCRAGLVSLSLSQTDDGAALVRALFEAPIATLVDELEILGSAGRRADDVDLGTAISALAEVLPPSCARLRLVDQRAADSTNLVSQDWQPDENLVAFGSLNAVWAIGHLESLELVVADPEQLELGTIDAPELRNFGLFGLRWPREPSEIAEHLANARWPQLETFAASLTETYSCQVPSNDGAYSPIDRYEREHNLERASEGRSPMLLPWNTELEPIVENLYQTKLKTLSLHDFANGRLVLDGITRRQFPNTLETLDLSRSEIGNDDAAWILRNEQLFRSLRVLDLRETHVSGQMVQTLSALRPRVLHSRGTAAHRYLVGWE